MKSPGATAGRRSVWKYLLVSTAIIIFLLGALAWYMTTNSFQAMVRQRFVAELERVTGGRVDLGGLHTVPFRFLVDVRNLTIHGREGPNEVPYVHIDRLIAHVKLISVLGAEFGFHSVVLGRPTVHIIFYPDGTTNQPGPQVHPTPIANRIQQVFSLSIGRLEVKGGEVLWNDRKLPLDFVANDVSADMDYSLLHRRYDGNLSIGRIETRLQDYRPVSWALETHFALEPDGLEIRSFKATAGRSGAQLSGRLIDFAQPNVIADYDVTLDLQEAGAILHQPQVRHGVLQAKGHGSWGGIQFSSTGNLALKDFDWRDQALSLHATSFGSQFSVNPQRLSLSSVTGKLLGGDVTGDAEVINWLPSLTADKNHRQKTSNAQRGTIHLRLKDLSAQEIATTLSSSARPFLRMNLAGAASGALETHWKGTPRDAETEITLDVSAPRQPLPGQLPVDAHAHAIYRAAAEELEVSEFTASTRATQVHASGTLSRQAALKVAVTTSDLGEWEPVLTAAGYQEGLPVTLRGRASFTGFATGRISAIEFNGRVQSQAFETRALTVSPNSVVHWDYLAADVQLSPEHFALHNGTLHHGDTLARFDVNAGLDNRQFLPSSPFKAKLQIHDADVGEVLAVAGRNYAASGKMDISLQATGTRAHPEGQGSVHVTGASVQGEVIQELDSQFSCNTEELSLEDIRLTQDDALVTGNGAYDFISQAYRLNLHGDNFDLARFPTVQSTRVNVGGRLEFDAQSSGTPQQPVINAKIHLHDLTFDHERAGDYTLDAVTKGPDLHLSGRSQFKEAELAIDGDIHMRGDWPSKVNLHFNHLDVDPLLEAYLRAPLTSHSGIAGDVYLQGPLRNPRELEVTGDISDIAAELAHIPVHNNGPVRFTVSGATLNLQRFRLMGERTDLEIGGSVQLEGERQVDLHAEGHADLALVHSLNPDFTSSGDVAVNVTVSGTSAHLTAQGRMQISGGSIQYRDLPSALSDLNGSLVFNQDRLHIESLTARVGGGNVEFGGYATAYNHQLNFDLTMRGQDVRLRYPPGVSSMTNTQLRWAGTPAASTLSGDATITKLAVTPGFDFASYLASSAQSSALPQTNPLLSRIRMDVHIVTTPELQMQTAVVRLSGDADLHLRGTAAKPVLLGRADVMEGDVYFNGAKYRLERGDITFANPVTTTPVLDLQAATRVRDYDITVNLNGQFDKLNLSYHSEPPLPTADIISLLALGQTQEQSAQLQQSGQSPFAQQASSAVLSEAINSALSNRSQRLFGISHIKIDPQGLNTETTPVQSTPLPAVTIEQQVRDNLTLTYSTEVAQRSQQVIQGEYNITRDLSFVGIRDYNGVVSFEVRLRRRRK